MVHKRKVALVVDSSSCLPQNLLEECQISVVPHELLINDRSFRDGIDIEPGEFYRQLQKNLNNPTTSSPSPATFLEVFRLAGTYAPDIVCITISENFSATYHSACLAAEMAERELPDCRIKVMDSKSAAGAMGLIALDAARLAMTGADVDQVTSRVEDLISNVNLLAILDTLYYLRRSGRVPRVAAWAGTILGIKPLAELKLGEAKVVGKPRSRARAMDRLVEVINARLQDKPVHLNLMHAHAAADAEQMRQRLQSAFNCRELFVSEFTPVMGAHLGPGLLGTAFYTD